MRWFMYYLPLRLAFWIITREGASTIIINERKNLRCWRLDRRYILVEKIK